VSDVPVSASSSAPRFHGEYVTTPKFAAQLTGASFRMVLLRPARIVSYAILAILVVSVLVSTAANVRNGGTAFAGYLFVGIFVAAFSLIYVLGYFAGRRRVEKRLPAGSRYTLDLYEDTMALGEPMSKTELSYALFKSATRYGHFVRLERRIGRIPTLLPNELFTDESLAWLAERVRTSNHTQP
jgi:hypothetical protein